jgi:tRNA threonylcarbamoyl adenosine modification protein YeaZ/ribosomal-protein-alanine acetyltransferase
MGRGAAPAGATGSELAGGGLTLALDAGSPLVSVAIGRGGEVLAARAVAQQRSSTQLLALVAEALAAAGARPADLEGVVALAGPGSFTGLRVGLATALGLHQALGLRAQAVPTLAALAAASEAPAGSLVVAAVDALRGEWSAQAFRAELPAPRALGEMTLVTPEGLWRGLVEPPRVDGGAAGMPGEGRPAPALPPPVIVAFGAAVLSRALAAAGRGPARFQEAPPLAPAALRLAAALPPADWRAASLAAPIYSRPPATTTPRARPGDAARMTAADASVVRPAAATDLPRLAELEAVAFADPWSPALLAAELTQPGGVMLVASGGGDDARAVGYACFRLGGGEAELLRVAVEPPARGHGIARRLIAAGFERLRAAGITSCFLEVRPGNASALAVYRALGFEPCGLRRAYYRDGSDALVLRRAL